MEENFRVEFSSSGNMPNHFKESELKSTNQDAADVRDADMHVADWSILALSDRGNTW